jgi:NodT family efflux transporter outer membrane factor (OMF) lipoprotein
MSIVFHRRFAFAVRLSASFALAAALGACGVAPVPAPRADVPDAWRHDTALGPAPDFHGWWRAFGDAELDRLVERSLAENLSLQQAAYRVRAARALASQSAAALKPEVSAHTFAEPAPDSSASYFQAGFDAKWEFGLFGRGESNARVAAADVGLAEVDADAARVSVVAEVARAYVEMRAAERRLALMTELADLSRRKQTLVATRERLRLASASDAAASAAELANAEAALVEPRVAIEGHRAELSVLLGERAPIDIANGAPPSLGAFALDTAPADLVRTRPEIRKAELEILKAAGELGIAHADLYPRLALGGSLTTAWRIVGHTKLADADSTIAVGPLIDIPIFDWGARRAVVDARDAALQAAVIGYRKAVLEGVAEVETDLATLAGARERVETLARAASALETAETSATTLRRVGLADDVDRAAATSALLRAELDAADAESARNLAFIALYKSLGGAPLPEAPR